MKKLFNINISIVFSLSFIVVGSFVHAAEVNNEVDDDQQVQISKDNENTNQSKSMTPTTELEETIIITGEKINRSLQETVSSVGVLTEAQIEEAAIYDLQDLYTRLANVSQAFGEEGLVIRGINHSSVGGGGSGGLISIHIDGAFLTGRAITVGQAELWDIQQVEVFRGPQSTNQGRNSLGGSVFVRSNDPTYEWEGKYRAMYGEDDTQALSVAFGGPIITDQLAFRIAIDDQYTNGPVNNVTLNDDSYGENGNTMFRGKLLFEPNALPGFSLLTTLSYSENESGDPFVSLIDEEGEPLDPFARLNFANIEGFENHDQTITTLEANYELNDIWSITGISSWNKSEYQRQDDSDRQATGDVAQRTRTDDADTFSQEVRFNFNSKRYEGNIGLFYYKRELDGTTLDLLTEDLTNDLINAVNVLAPPLAPLAEDIAALYPVPMIFTRDGPNTTDVENLAIYGNISYDVTDFVTLFGGFRFDEEEVTRFLEEERTLDSVLPDPTNLPVALAPAAGFVAVANAQILAALDVTTLDTSTKYDAFLPAAGVTLNWTDDLNTSFRIQRAYRAGGSGTSTSGNFEFDPEFSTNYEFALRSQWLDNRLTVNANLFYIDWTDQQVQIVDPVFPTEFITVNAGESELKGFELEIAAQPTDALSLFASIGYVETEFTQFVAESTNGTEDFTGNEFIGAPDNSSAVGFQYDINNRLSIQADASYVSGSFDNVENTVKNDSRTVLNAKVAYKLNEHTRLTVIGRNLTDKDYITRGDISGDNIANVGQPRIIALQVEGGW